MIDINQKIPIIQSQIDDLTWNIALGMYLSEHPNKSKYENSVPYDSACDEFMDLPPDAELPEDFTLWMPFEHWNVGAVQELITEAYDLLEYYHTSVLALCGVIEDKK